MFDLHVFLQWAIHECTAVVPQSTLIVAKVETLYPPRKGKLQHRLRGKWLPRPPTVDGSLSCGSCRARSLLSPPFASSFPAFVKRSLHGTKRTHKCGVPICLQHALGAGYPFLRENHHNTTDIYRLHRPHRNARLSETPYPVGIRIDPVLHRVRAPSTGRRLLVNRQWSVVSGR